jgi:hypothetical protein
MAFKKDGPGGCCCCPDCSVFLESFTVDSIAEYTQLAGDWVIDTTLNHLTTAVSPGMILCNTPAPDKQHSITAVFHWTNSHTNLDQVDEVRAILAYLDEDNYLCVRITTRRTTSFGTYYTHFKLALIARRLGVESVLSESTEWYDLCPTSQSTYLPLRACFADGYFSCIWGFGTVAGNSGWSPSWLRSGVSYPNDFGQQCGLAITSNYPDTVSVGPAYFPYANGFQILKQDHGCLTCNPQWGLLVKYPICEPDTFPRTMQVEISGVTGYQADLWNGTFLLTYDPSQAVWSWGVNGDALMQWLSVDLYACQSSTDRASQAGCYVLAREFDNLTWEYHYARGTTFMPVTCCQIDCGSDVNNLIVSLANWGTVGSSDFTYATARVTSIW